MKRVTAIMGAGLAIAGTIMGTAIAQDEFAGPIGARQGLMALYGANLGPLVTMAKGEMDYDAEAAQAFADNMVALSGIDQRNLWPQGSDNVALPGRTRSKPEIWTTFPDVLEKAEALQTASVALAAVASDGLDAMAGAVGGVGKACGACHQTFRGPAN